MYEILLTIHVIVAVLLVGLILIQQGKGAQAGASFGSGASQTVFGSQGTGNFLSRSTAILATAFFIFNLLLAFLVNKATKRAVPAPVVQEIQLDSEANNNDKPVLPDNSPEIPD